MPLSGKMCLSNFENQARWFFAGNNPKNWSLIPVGKAAAPRKRSERSEEEKNLFALPGIESQFFNRSACSPSRNHINISVVILFSFFWKIKVALWDHYAVCVSAYPLIDYWMPEPIFMKLGMHVMAPESMSTAYFTNPPIGLCVCDCRCIPLSFLGNGNEYKLQ
jgi:hypothetical protein